jgi:pimeloyl-ACP methyl ester carboxylesterase
MVLLSRVGAASFDKTRYDLGDRRFLERRAWMAKWAKALGAVVALAAVNCRLERGGGLLLNRLGGETRYYSWRGGDLAYAVAGEGEPLLLVHGVYAGASSLEFRKNFGELSRDFRVYALDLLGCGLSERPRRRYAPEDVTAQVEDFVRGEIGGSAHLVASSLSGALSVPALVRSPRLFKKTVLICPTGYGSLDRTSGHLGGAIYGLFLVPVVGDSLYHAIVSRRGIRYYLERMAYHDPRFVTDDLVEDYYRISHQGGAKYFPAAFVSGKLNLGLADYWPRVPHRTLICWGREARTTPVSEAEEFVRRNPRSEPRIFRDAALLPHNERAETFNGEVREFLLRTRASRRP